MVPNDASHTDSFVGTVALLGEQISIQKWRGIALIALGVHFCIRA
jgi:uncharacterized membrane protein